MRKLYSLSLPLFSHFARRKGNISYKKGMKTYNLESIVKMYNLESIRDCAKGLLRILNRLGLIRNSD
jgi:hypothetical protein